MFASLNLTNGIDFESKKVNLVYEESTNTIKNLKHDSYVCCRADENLLGIHRNMNSPLLKLKTLFEKLLKIDGLLSTRQLDMTNLAECLELQEITFMTIFTSETRLNIAYKEIP